MIVLIESSSTDVKLTAETLMEEFKPRVRKKLSSIIHINQYEQRLQKIEPSEF